jgi:hypothetical protein
MRSSRGAPVQISRSIWITVTLVFVCLAAALTPAAQNTSPAPLSPTAGAADGPVLLVIVDVKPEFWDDYVALQKTEAIPALQKGGVEHRSAWRTAGFGRAYQVAYLYQLKSYAILDGDPPMRKALGEQGEKAYNTKLRRMVVGSRSCATRLRTDLGFDTPAVEPKLGVLAHVYTLPGKQAEYESALKSDWVPGLRKAGVSVYTVHEVVMGGEMGEFYTFTPIDNLAALDGGHPIRRGLGESAYNAVLAKIAPTVRTVERTVIRRDPDLSFTLKPGTSSQ